MRVCNREVLIRPSSLVASASPCSRATAIRTFRTSSTLSKRASPPSPPSNQPRSEALPPPAPFKTKTVLSLQPNVYYPANQLHSVPKASSPNSITRDRAGAIGGGEVYAVQGERSHHRVSFTGAKFMTSAGSISSLPKKSSLQEVIIAGRSNSGKSSLINALLSSTKLVKTSGKTGHTKTLNFFEIPKQFILVDSPGYGESGRAEWSSLFKYYITRREPSPPSLVIALFQLTKDLAPSDLLFVESLPPTVNLLPVFTKTDICPLDQIVERKRLLNTRIQSLRDIVAREAEDEVEVEAQGQGLKPELPRRGRTWPGMCVAIKPGWVLRDQTVDNVRAVILKQLEVSAALDARIRSNPVTSRHDPLAGIKFRPQRTRHPHKTPSEISAASSPSSSNSLSAVSSPLSHLTRSEALRMGVKNLDALRAQQEAMAQMDEVEAGMGASCRGGLSEWIDSTWVEETVKHGRETRAPGSTRGSSYEGREGIGGRGGRGAGHKSLGSI